jgi:hypothetical protein
MRFAYIDSHGNEVPIPSVDALALRIELGAIGPDTELYDAQADHWGPASTHEIFHTLSRDAGGEGFIAPPPPAAPAAPVPPQAVTHGPAKEPKKPAKKKDLKKPPPKKETPAKAPPDLGLTLADPQPTPAKMKERATASPNADDLGLDIEPPLAELDVGGPALGTPAAAGSDADDDAGFDFGGLGSGLELEDAPMDLATGGGPLDPGMEGIERGMDFGAMDLGVSESEPPEEPMSGFGGDAPPGWMDGPSETDEVMDFSSVSDEVATNEEPLAPAVNAPARQRLTPKDRPSAHRFKRQRSLSGPIVFVVLLLLLGVGGYVGWPLVAARLARRSEPSRPPVVMPTIPEQLTPRLHTLAQGAIADAVDEVSHTAFASDAPSAPDQEWLAGVYLGNASRFPDVEAFWSSVGKLIQGLRDGDARLYHDKFVARVAAASTPADTAAMLVERADSGFAAAATRREDTYATMQRLVDASLDLHDFLLQNEANIEYRPASASTADPVLEAVPSSAALGDQMWSMVDSITDALDALGSLDRVTRDRLLGALTTRLQQVGMQ